MPSNTSHWSLDKKSRLWDAEVSYYNGWMGHQHMTMGSGEVHYLDWLNGFIVEVILDA